jgi:hypothetical protein
MSTRQQARDDTGDADLPTQTSGAEADRSEAPTTGKRRAGESSHWAAEAGVAVEPEARGHTEAEPEPAPTPIRDDAEPVPLEDTAAPVAVESEPAAPTAPADSKTAEPTEHAAPTAPADSKMAQPTEHAASTAPADSKTATTESDTTAEQKEAAKDPWSTFAPAQEEPPTRSRQVGAAVGRLLIHEWTLASVGAVLLAIVMTWPTLRDPLHTLPRDLGDPTLVTWMMAWSGHILSTDPAHLWHGNAFYPEQWSFAFTESLLGYAPLGLIGNGPEAAVLRYNVVYVLIFALSFVGAYALARQLGAGRFGSAVAGAAFAYAPWRLAQAGHLHVISTGGIALALAMLARGHGWSLRYGYRPDRRNVWWIFGGWLVAAWQITVGIGIGVPFAYILLLVGLLSGVGWLVTGRPKVGWRVLAMDVAGGLLFGTVCLLMSLPYRKVVDLHPEARRSINEVTFFSPPLRGYFTAPPDSLPWGELHDVARSALPWHPEMTLLPGFALYGLAAAGLVFSVWRLRTRLLLAVGVLVSIMLGLGATFDGDGRPGYLTLYQHLYGWDALRTPGRFIIWTTLLLGLLAAGTVSAFGVRAGQLTADRVPDRPGPWLRFAMLIPLVVVLAEGTNRTPHPVVPPAPAALSQVDGPIMVLPSHDLFDMQVMLWSTDTFPRMVNGGSGFVPPGLRDARQATQTFPDATSIEYLRTLGVETVVLLPAYAGGTPWANAADIPVDGLGITRKQVADAVVYDLNP